MKRLLCAAAVGLAFAATPARALVVYSDDFTAPPTVGGGATAVFAPAGGGSDPAVAPYAATYGSYFRNSSTGLTTLTLSGLPSHTGVNVSYILGLLESWDSRDGSCCTPDNLDFYIGGTLAHSYTYNNALGTIKDIGGGTLLHEYVQFNGNGYYSDTIIDMAGDPMLTFAHSASSLTLAWQASGVGWQGGGDEAWGIDNLRVELTGVTFPPSGAVPLPSTLALLLAGACGVRTLRRAPS